MAAIPCRLDFQKITAFGNLTQHFEVRVLLFHSLERPVSIIRGVIVLVLQTFQYLMQTV